MYSVQLSESYFPKQEDFAVIDKTVGEILREAATAVPDTCGLVDVLPTGETGRRWTYQEMLDDSLALAHWLAARFNKGDRVAVWSPNSPEWVLFEFACGFAGLILVTVNPSYQPKELSYVLKQSGSVALFLVHEYRGNPMGEIAEKVAKDIPHLQELVYLDSILDRIKGEQAAPSLPDVSPGDPAQIQYTSGTTGFPKGALLHHKGMVNSAYHQQCILNMLDTQARIITMMPMFHCSGCGLAVLGSVLARSTNYIVSIFIPSAVNALVERESINMVFGVPTMLVALLEDYRQTPRDFSAMSHSGSGGAMVPPELVRRVIDTWECSFITVYGQTETSPLITMTRPLDSVETIATTIGQPMPQIEVAIKDTDTGAILPCGTQGEICTRGYLNMLGYHENPDATDATIDAEGWLHTGDLGTMDESGYLRITGRVKEMIIRGGENLFPAEIENCLLEHPAVAEIAVVGLPDDKWGEIVGAFIRLSTDTAISPEELSPLQGPYITAKNTVRMALCVRISADRIRQNTPF
ncbi:AMP-binding protein [Kordiimonas sediminis]|uniref:AMP-binding protein n=1 Tax=Kordiimonas sediminis TaxID=1735581 RepID=A0A919AQ16_9PROT|nr:AMP-binding protein [Kordiimonas sediminis]GHF19571.1 AMP-binding protein [Kordiimonas sediminis]